jgi:hypothetical protein
MKHLATLLLLLLLAACGTSVTEPIAAPEGPAVKDGDYVPVEWFDRRLPG